MVSRPDPDCDRLCNRLRDRVRRGPSPIHGNGCFARVAFSAGDFIGTYQGPVARRDGTYVLWISEDHVHWIGRSGRNLLRWLNHSDAPNAEFDGFDLYALTAIGVGEEITFDYAAGDVAAAGEPAGAALGHERAQ